MGSFLAIPLTFVLVFTSVANADTSLWIPGVDEQPISATLLGVGNDGRTTWGLQQGTPTGTFTDPQDFGFPGTAKLVEGASDAFLSQGVVTQGVSVAIELSCAVSNGIAVCDDILSQGSTVSSGTETETVSSFLVQGGGSATSTGLTTAGPVSVAPTQSAGSQASAGASPTSAGAQATGTGSGKSSAGRHQVSGSLLGIGLLVGSLISCL